MRLITVPALWFLTLLWGKYFTRQKNANQSSIILTQRKINSIRFKSKFSIDLCKVIGEIYGHSWFAVVKPYIFNAKWHLCLLIGYLGIHTINCVGIRKVYFLSPAHILPFWESLLGFILPPCYSCRGGGKKPSPCYKYCPLGIHPSSS